LDVSKLTLVFFDAGGGHRAAAQALASVIRSQNRPWEIELLNLQELLDEIDPARKFLRIRVQDVYNRILSRGWTLGAPTLLKGLHVVIGMYHGKIVRQLTAHWQRTSSKMVVSLIPNFNSCLAESVYAALPGVPFVTVLTDLADYPPHFWMERESQYIICGSERGCQQASALGHDKNAVFRVSGMILNPRFYQPVQLDRSKVRGELGLDPELPTALILFGGYGSRDMITVADRLQDVAHPLQAIFICGRNAHLEQKLRRRKLSYRFAVEGFTSEIPRYMTISDFLIGKPGPGCISEAIQMKLPVIVSCNRWTLPQERFNAHWIEECGVGISVGSFREIGTAAETMMAELASFRSRAEELQNRALFEVVDCFEHIFQQHPVRPAVNQECASVQF
jgi:1,2-diacylglycerol 3-beta-galactosyltransferase